MSSGRLRGGPVVDFDVFMIAYRERNRAAHWERLRGFVPEARLVQGIKGIAAAHCACAELARTPWFFVVDADNWVLDGFDFAVPFDPDPDEVATWAATNPINGLYYGHGGIKLFPKARFAEAATRDFGIDMSMNLALRNRWLDIRASEHRFNTDPYNTWGTAFRECVKLVLGTTLGGFRPRALARARLETWCTKGAEARFGQWCLAGAREGRLYGRKYCRDDTALQRINDYAWMRALFDRLHRQRPVGSKQVPERSS